METDKLLYRIFLGYYFINLNSKKYKIIYPNLQLKYEAELLYEQLIEDNKFEKRYLNDYEINFFLESNNIWLKSDEEKLKNCEKFLEESKIQLYLNFSNEKDRVKNQKNIDKAKKDLDKFYSKKNSFNHLSISEHAMSIKNEFIIINTIYNENNTLVFDNINDKNFDYYQLQPFIREVLDNSISPTQLRTIARSDLWRSYSVANNFEKDILSMNDDLRHLLNLHKMYDSVRQHPETPNEEIINNDDALDGWFIFQNRKSEKEKKKNNILNKLGNNKTQNAGEVFIMTDDINERDDIYSLNDGEARIMSKEVIEVGKTLGNKSMSWQDLASVQRQIRSQVQEKSLPNRKGNIR